MTRSYLDEKRSKELLAYTPMLHARLFKEQAKFRDAHFQPTKGSLLSQEKSAAALWLDGNPTVDRPLFVQFCANKPEDLLEAAQYVAPYCDAVDLNLGCPQGIAKSGHYGAFLQEDWDTIHNMIRKLRDELSIPVTAKMRILDTKEKTLEYAKMILSAGASILTVHGRRREQKSHNTGIADWAMIRYLRDNLPPETVLFANGNILNHNDVEPCLQATGADGVMSAEGNLSDPTIFAKPPSDVDSREYWRDPTNPAIGGYRVDGVFRRYLDIIHRHVLEQEPPQRAPLYIVGDKAEPEQDKHTIATESTFQDTTSTPATTQPNGNAKTKANIRSEEPERPSKKQKKLHKQKKDMAAVHNPNLKPIQGHLFQLLRPMIAVHIQIRDALARCRAGDITAVENVLRLVEEATKAGLDEEHARLHGTTSAEESDQNLVGSNGTATSLEGSAGARERCKRPFWVCQPYIRPLPEEAIKIGAMTLSKKDKEKLAQDEALKATAQDPQKKAEPTSQAGVAESVQQSASDSTDADSEAKVQSELPKQEALACG